jgi:hypothetical protein
LRVLSGEEPPKIAGLPEVKGEVGGEMHKKQSCGNMQVARKVGKIGVEILSRESR